MSFVKIDPDTFDEVPAPTKRIKLSEINAQLNILRAQRDSMTDPTNSELNAWARQFHPMMQEKNLILAEIDLLQTLKDTLQAL